MPLRAVIVMLALVSLAALPQRLLSGEFPYRAAVTADDVFVRGGPGQNYYPTNKLQEGETVEVYRHDPGGWYAIRPPQGSYSWVSARYLDMLNDEVAVVTGEEVVARVGSHLSDARDVWQVKLEREEEVLVLEKVDSTEGQWYRISPPRGEFRWIHGKYLQPLAADVANDGPQRDRAEARAESQLRHVDVAALSGSREREAEADPVRPYREEGPDDQGDPRLEPPRESDLRPSRAADELPEVRPLALDTRDGRAALREIDSQLTARVCREEDLWNFTDLRAAAESILETSDSAVERTHARLTLERIARFEGIRQKKKQLQQEIAARERPQTVARRRTVGGVAPATARMASRDPRLDGQGRLLPVKSKNPNAPQFALVDEEGNLKSFVTPAPGVNLRAYQGKTVGIVGSRGYSPELKAQHITAKRITVDPTGTKLR